MKRISRVSALLVIASGALGCIATDSSPTTVSTGCEAITGDTIDRNLDVDATVKVFMQASVDFRSMARKVKAAAKTACVNVARDLGAPDTWSKMGESNESISNANGTGACDAAALRIRQIMESPAAAQANFALISTPGACRTDFAAQAACDAKCKAEATCDSGKVETRCTPGELACVCDEKCKTSSFCEGTVEVEASCNGKCEAQCTGECKGTCISKDGKKTTNDASCRGKCNATCNGKCSGTCKVEVESGISCGTKVRCKGECTTTYTEPVCETELTPPSCKVDASCEASCSASVAANAICDPPHWELFANASVSSDVAKLVASLNANVPPLLVVAEQQGKLAVRVAQKLAATGEVVVQSAGKLGAKSAVCSAAAAKASVEAAASLSVTVRGSVNVIDACKTRST